MGSQVGLSHANILVMQCCYFLSLQEIIHLHMDELDAFALVFSGLCHDVGHPGKTNLFMQNSKHKLALRYFDKSVSPLSSPILMRSSRTSTSPSLLRS